MRMNAAVTFLLEVNLLFSQVLAVTPYDLDYAQVGYARFALLVGGITDISLSGPCSDWNSASATKKRQEQHP